MEENNGFRAWWPVMRVAAVLALVYAFWGGIIEWLKLGTMVVLAGGTVLLLANDGSKILVSMVDFLARWNATQPFAQVLGQATIKEQERAKENGKTESEIKKMDLASILAYLKPEKKEAEGKKEAEAKGEVTIEQLQELLAQYEALKNEGKEEVKEEKEDKGEGKEEGKAS